MNGVPDSRPFIVLTAVMDVDARSASVTRSHGEAYERVLRATSGQAISGLELVELPIPKQAHAALRRHLGLPPDTAGVYDVFPLVARLNPAVRTAAAQFLAAESLWNLDAQGVFGKGGLSVRLKLPEGWSKEPQAVHAKLVESGALDLSAEAIETFKAVKTAFDVR
jgi:hypothetical protein